MALTRGALGEQIAAQYLQNKGFSVLARNYHSRWGEIDIIVANAQFLVFVEVKLRKNDRYGRACEAVTATKQAKLIATAEQWLQQNPTDLQPRFDVVEIYMDAGQTQPRQISVIENAF